MIRSKQSPNPHQNPGGPQAIGAFLTVEGGAQLKGLAQPAYLIQSVRGMPTPMGSQGVCFVSSHDPLSRTLLADLIESTSPAEPLPGQGVRHSCGVGGGRP